MLTATVTWRIPFQDVDPAMMVWHGNYPHYLEMARARLLETVGYSYPQMAESGYLWPVSEMTIRYRQPIRFDQSIDICATLTEWEYRLRVDYRLSCNQTGELMTTAVTDQVPVLIATGEMQVGVPRQVIQLVEAAMVTT